MSTQYPICRQSCPVCINFTLESRHNLSEMTTSYKELKKKDPEDAVLNYTSLQNKGRPTVLAVANCNVRDVQFIFKREGRMRWTECRPKFRRRKISFRVFGQVKRSFALLGYDKVNTVHNIFVGPSLSHNDTYALPQHWKAIRFHFKHASGIRKPARNSSLG